ncbi:MAG: SusC/RagA family TonB-linked outer membrane protein [Mucilaginibacter sp.]
MRKFYLKQYLLICAFLVMLTGISFAQTKTITGKVVDETNQPLPGAVVKIKGTQISAPTDVNGAYRLTGVTNGEVTLQANFIGYIVAEQTITVTGNATVNFRLLPESKSLNEVVVIGYGSVLKKDLTGSIATVTSKDFNTGVVTSPEQLIQGKVAGVSIISNSGAPGSGSTIRIRGGASVNGSNDPLIVIDGVPLASGGISGVASPLDLINPNDIESFSILKDASAAAIYGNRASNGVIIITTKKGQSGKPQINFNTQMSVGKLPKEAPILTADQFRAYVTANDTTTAKKYISLLGNANTDWQKEIYQTSVSTNNNLSVSGTAGKLPYRVSVGYDNQNGILKTSDLKRYTGSVSLTPSFFKDHLKINFNFIGSQVKEAFANEGAIGSANNFNPTLPVYSGNARFGGYYELLDPSAADGLKALAPLNPVGLLYEQQNRSTVYRAITSLAIDYKFHFFSDLHANVNVSYDGSNGQGYNSTPASAASAFPGSPDANGVTQQGNNSKYKSVVGNSLLEGYLSYTHDFKSIKSHVSAVAGYSTQTFKNTSYSYLSYFGNGEVNPASVASYPYYTNQFDLASVYARVNYAYDDKYLLTGTMRSDVSTKFAPGSRTGNFPSVAGAWVISHEDFLKDNKTLSNLKLRLEYGVTGNQDGIGDYDYLSDYALSNTTARYQFGSTYYQAYRPGAIVPRTWEQTATTNAAIDYGFLNERITGSIDYYYRNTKNLLFTIPQAAGANFTNTITGNVGNMVDQGVEASISAKIIDTKDLSWTVGVNATLDRNKITNLTQIPNPNFPGIQAGGISGGTGNFIQILQLGYAKGTFYTYQQVYGTNGKPLDNVVVDRNGDGIINNQDLYKNHNSNPQEFFGLNSDIRVKKWNAGFVARASVGNYVYNNRASATGIQRNFLNPLGIIENGSSDVLTSGFSGNGANTILSDYYIQNGSFFKMDNIHIGYNFGKVFKGAGNLSISGNVQNVFTITDYKGVDPELSSGIDNNLYPRPRTYVLGLNLNL